MSTQQARAYVYESERWPGYGLLWLGEDICVPVMVRNGEIVDCFTRGMGAVTAFTDDDEAWAFIEHDYAAMHPSE